MDPKLFISVFTMIFLAELGDKTQIAAIAFGSESKSTWTVLLAVICALSLAGVVGVVAGKILGSALNPVIVKFVSGTLFIAVGVWTLLKG